VSEKAKGYRVW